MLQRSNLALQESLSQLQGEHRMQSSLKQQEAEVMQTKLQQFEQTIAQMQENVRG